MENQTPKYCPNCGAPTFDEAQCFCEKCGARFDVYTGRHGDAHENAFETVISSQSEPAALPMKWYKFIVYFTLVVGPIINAMNAFMYFTGQYTVSVGFASGGAVSYVMGYDLYKDIPALRITDLIYAVLTVGLVFYAFYVKGRLKEFRTDAPRHFIYYYIAGAVLTTLDNSLTSVLLGDTMTKVIIIVALTVVEVAVFIYLNVIYFRKRSYLFVN